MSTKNAILFVFVYSLSNPTLCSAVSSESLWQIWFALLAFGIRTKIRADCRVPFKIGFAFITVKYYSAKKGGFFYINGALHKIFIIHITFKLIICK